MKTYIRVLLVASLLPMSAPALAETQAVDIGIGSIGGPLDNAAVKSVRKTVGKAVARGTVDTFVVYSPKVGGPVPIEGGLSACAQSGFTTTLQAFGMFIQELLNIVPDPGTFYNVEPAKSCSK